MLVCLLTSCPFKHPHPDGLAFQIWLAQAAKEVLVCAHPSLPPPQCRAVVLNPPNVVTL